MLQKILTLFHRLLDSPKTFFVIVGLLIAQALWFALTVQYPMAFDENYHLGIIQIYAQQWLPFIQSNPPGSEAYGDITRYGSYMFHYLMSFPYRLISLFTENFYIQVIFLRFINIALFVGGLFAFRHVLRYMRISRKLTNFTLLLLVLIPVVPFLAATINYDNLILLIVPLFIWLVVKSDQDIHKSTLSARTLALLIALGCFGSLVKYAFLPIFGISIVYLVILWLRAKKRQQILSAIIASLKHEKPWVQFILALLTVISVGLFIERYGVNIVQYQKYEPTCSAVRPISECVQYGPWGRDYRTQQTVQETNPPHNPAIPLFVPAWIDGLLYRLYFAINYDYSNKQPLPLPFFTAYIVGVIGLIAAFIYSRSIVRKNRYLLLLGIVIVTYGASLFYVNFSSYMDLRTMVAINGRYFLIIMPFIFIWLAHAYRHLFTSLFKRRATSLLSMLGIFVIIATLNGGGMITHLVRSEPSWFWQSGPEAMINATAQDIVQPVIIDFKHR